VSGKRPQNTLDEVYAWVVRFVDEHGYSPTTREMSAGLSISSSVAQYWLEKLDGAGMIRRGPRGTSRTFTVVR
jgi:SOS-response transcriptional repressor LexA